MAIQKRWRAGLVLGLLALAFAAVPAFASAAEVTDEAGNPLALGSVIEGTSTNTVTVVAGGQELACSHVEISGELTANSGTVAATGLGSDSASGCTLTGVGAVEVTVSFNSLTLTSPSSGSASFNFTVHIPGGPSCVYSGTAKTTYIAGSSSIHIAGAVSTSTPGCPPSGNISGDFALSSEGSAVVID